MHHSLINWRVTFLAVVNDGYDWAVYLSASTEDITEAEAEVLCLEYGNKLIEEVAHTLFPFITETYRK